MARDDDEALPKPASRLEPLRLEKLAIDELTLYIEALKREIARVETDIERKQGHLRAADAFFRRPD